MCAAAIPSGLCPSWVNSLHYRAAALLSASPQLAEPIRAAKRFRVVPTTDSRAAAKKSPYRASPLGPPAVRGTDAAVFAASVTVTVLFNP
jgi:hypothetical protein